MVDIPLGMNFKDRIISGRQAFKLIVATGVRDRPNRPFPIISRLEHFSKDGFTGNSISELNHHPSDRRVIRSSLTITHG